MPDDVAATKMMKMISQLTKAINYQKDMGNNYMDCIPIHDLETLIRAASTPSAEVQELQSKVREQRVDFDILYNACRGENKALLQRIKILEGDLLNK